jgi:hypothetical protein
MSEDLTTTDLELRTVVLAGIVTVLVTVVVVNVTRSVLYKVRTKARKNR